MVINNITQKYFFARLNKFTKIIVNSLAMVFYIRYIINFKSFSRKKSLALYNLIYFYLERSVIMLIIDILCVRKYDAFSQILSIYLRETHFVH